MAETVVIEAVTDKYKNKYNSGSVLVGGKWIQVVSKIPINLFQKDQQMTVETKTNEKGYKSITAVLDDAPDAPEAVEAPVKRRATAKSESMSTGKTVTTDNYTDNKNKQIRVQGVLQAVAQCPALAGLPFTTVQDISKNIKELALDLIVFVEEESK